ncbi:U2 small nuclear ribonucleo auxiliary factor 35 kDa subunit-related 2 [Brachionus plicatilis]|uniref:U2 small nuclear ribonucleo auxiliary factor 35 kDa subunit-related 2 n=1 Tax=Brachionus plicatilis TaxID=10195 RepID=A0A3M7RVX9_BRAPC|nr:U2 small nuclear ribonucleo auxiliary factor 35 kDa subunit-related 2 [Brachionus plicatilis]
MSKLKINPDTLIRHNDSEYKFKDLIDLLLKPCSKVNHNVYRKAVKKVRRKYLRQQEALKLEKIKTNFPRIESRPVDEAEVEQIEKEKAHRIWLEREKLAQLEWKTKKEQNEKILLKVKEKEKRLEEISKSKQSQKTNLAPGLYIKPAFCEQNWEKCGFYERTGVCKYANLCSKSHLIDPNGTLTTLIFPAMYSNMLLGYELLKNDKDSDEALEYEEKDILINFKNFYDDVVSKLKTYGKLVQFLVCSNYQPHLRGNVYVQFEDECDTKAAFQDLNGRFYAGRQIFCYYSHVKNWRMAVCSKFLRNNCDKNRMCNYLHVFNDPYNEFKIEDLSNLAKNLQTRSSLGAWSSDEEKDLSSKENHAKKTKKKRKKRSRSRSCSKQRRSHKHKK